MKDDLFFHPVSMLTIQIFQAGAVGFGKLAFQRFAVAAGQINPRRMSIAWHLPQAACGGLQNKVVAVCELAHQRTGKQAGTVPAFGAHVDQQ